MAVSSDDTGATFKDLGIPRDRASGVDVPYLRNSIGTATIVELDVKARTRKVVEHEDRSSAYTDEEPLTWLEFIAVLIVYACSAVIGLGLLWLLIEAVFRWIR
jgi:hypothetical protein